MLNKENDNTFNDAWKKEVEIRADKAARALEPSFKPAELDDRSQLPVWPDVIQNSVFDKCDLVSRGYRLGNPENKNKILRDIRQKAVETARCRWMLWSTAILS